MAVLATTADVVGRYAEGTKKGGSSGLIVYCTTTAAWQVGTELIDSGEFASAVRSLVADQPAGTVQATPTANAHGPDFCIVPGPTPAGERRRAPAWTESGRRVLAHNGLYVASPTPGEAARMSLRDGAKMTWMSRVRVKLMSEAALVSTLGGGWASVHNVQKAAECSVRLYRCAVLLGDDDLAQKCRIFIGYAFLWAGNKAKARRIFEEELASSHRRKDSVARLRAIGAMGQLLNPRFNEDADAVDISANWAAVFAAPTAKQLAAVEQAAKGNRWNIGTADTFTGVLRHEEECCA